MKKINRINKYSEKNYSKTILTKIKNIKKFKISLY